MILNPNKKKNCAEMIMDDCVVTALCSGETTCRGGRVWLMVHVEKDRAPIYNIHEVLPHQGVTFSQDNSVHSQVI